MDWSRWTSCVSRIVIRYFAWLTLAVLKPSAWDAFSTDHSLNTHKSNITGELPATMLLSSVKWLPRLHLRLKSHFSATSIVAVWFPVPQLGGLRRSAFQHSPCARHRT